MATPNPLVVNYVNACFDPIEDANWICQDLLSLWHLVTPTSKPKVKAALDAARAARDQVIAAYHQAQTLLTILPPVVAPGDTYSHRADALASIEATRQALLTMTAVGSLWKKIPMSSILRTEILYDGCSIDLNEAVFYLGLALVNGAYMDMGLLDGGGGNALVTKFKTRLAGRPVKA